MSLAPVCVLLAGGFMLVATTPKYSMAPLSGYLMNPQSEIALARSAAPASVSNDATVVVLGRRGYAVAHKGRNGFTCIVERGWTQPFGARNFWDVRVRSPICYNAPAARTVLAYTFRRTDMALAGASKLQIQHRIVAAIAAHTLPTPAPSSMAYMLSKSQYLNEDAKAWYPHVMVFTSMSDSENAGESWGANRRLSPVILDSRDKMPEPWTCFFIPVAHWSDGTSAPLYLGM